MSVQKIALMVLAFANNQVIYAISHHKFFLIVFIVVYVTPPLTKSISFVEYGFRFFPQKLRQRHQHSHIMLEGLILCSDKCSDITIYAIQLT